MVLPAIVEAPDRGMEEAQITLKELKRGLRDLERKALELGMSRKELGTIQHIGSCEAQIWERKERLQGWISAHQS